MKNLIQTYVLSMIQLNSLNKLHQKFTISAIYETKDYTPFAIKRENEINQWCNNNNCNYQTIDDLYLLKPGTVRNQSGKIFQKFTPYYKKALEYSISKPKSIVKFGSECLLSKDEIINFSTLLKDIYIQNISKNLWTLEKRKYLSGRKEALNLLKNLPQNYNENSLYKSGSSVHHHNGDISIRESYWRAKLLNIDEFIRQLFWRDFYGQIMAYFKELYDIDPIEFQYPKNLNQR